MIRPRPARWFELLVARDDTTLALEALAATGAVELELRPGAAAPAGIDELRPLLLQFGELAQRYRAYWPVTGLLPSPVAQAPKAALERCLAVLRDWAREAEPWIRRLQQGEREKAELHRWGQLLAELGDASPLDLAQAAASGPALEMRLVVTPAATDLDAAADVLLRRFEPVSNVRGEAEHCALALGGGAPMRALAQLVLACKGQVCELPPWLGHARAANEPARRQREAALDADIAAARSALAALALRHRLHQALGDARRLQWLIDNVRALEGGTLLCWITGWTDADAATLERAVEQSGARALLRLSSAPAGALAPLLLVNPRWVRPFEVFVRALGMPSGTEVDTSVLLAIAVPLMFGYMFGDVGQGLLIAGAGFALRRRWPMARLFIAGGIASTVFGLLFGSVFSLHVLHALWLQPLDDPLTILLVPIVGGAGLLTLGLLLGAVQAHWRGSLAHWLATDAGLVLCYVALLGALAWAPALALAALGALWFCGGHALVERRAAAAASAAGEAIERTLQLLINTLSFARVGAFALAHAGLSSAIVALMNAAGSPLLGLLVLVLGNAVVIVLEGLVVSIQTTRLVLFEFFTRFLEARGRVFRPLPVPPSAMQEN